MPPKKPRGRPPKSKHLDTLLSNMSEVARLLEIHAQIAGPTVGQKHRVEVLNKASVVLLVACWEAFVEDLAESAFNLLLRRVKSPLDLPKKVMAMVSKKVKEEKDDRRLWEIVGDGWRAVFDTHKAAVLSRYLDSFNTPKPEQIDGLFEELLGISTLSKKWSWHKCPPAKARLRLLKLVGLRGDIAHRVSAPKAVQKRYVVEASGLVRRLAICSHNAVNGVLKGRLGFEPWRSYEIQAG
jgi:hypothetical protein